MPIYSLEGFANLLGRKKSAISMDKSRGKVLYNKEGNIDTDNAINKAYVERWLAKAELEKKESGSDIKVLPAVDFEKPIVAPHMEAFNAQVKATEDDENTVDTDLTEVPNAKLPNSLVKLQVIEKKINIRKTQKDTEKVQLQIDKLNGILIPTELVKMLFVHFSKEVQTAFHQAAENILVDISTTKQLTAKETATLRAKLITITNKATEAGVKNAKTGIANIIDEFSQSRGKGERK